MRDLILLVGFGAQLALAQQKAPIRQQAGDCAVNIAGNNNTASLICKNLDPTIAGQVQAILNSTRRNEKASKDISAKLERILNDLEQLSIGQRSIKPSDVAIRLVHPKSPALLLVNQSAVVAREIKWTVALWNMDLSDRNDPLPIPIKTFDWIRPNEVGGPQQIFNNLIVNSFLKSGDRLMGTISVNCPECTRGRTYVVFIVWNEGGWFSEVEIDKPGSVLVPESVLNDGLAKFLKALEAAVPTQQRLPIL